MKDILKLIRPQQWIKNLFVFIPMFFSSELFDTEVLMNSLIMFVAFCFTASSIYCYNDIVDADDDRNHPEKCHRPIAAGKVSVGAAYRIMGVTFILSIGTALTLPAPVMPSAVAVLLFYYVLNLAYCSRLKQYAIIDVCIVAFGFVLRILAGGIVGEIMLSKWIVLMTFLLQTKSDEQIKAILDMAVMLLICDHFRHLLRILLTDRERLRGRTQRAIISLSSTRPSP